MLELGVGNEDAVVDEAVVDAGVSVGTEEEGRMDVLGSSLVVKMKAS